MKPQQITGIQLSQCPSFCLQPSLSSPVCLSVSVPSTHINQTSGMHTHWCVLPHAHLCIHTPAMFISLCCLLGEHLGFVIWNTVI